MKQEILERSCGAGFRVGVETGERCGASWMFRGVHGFNAERDGDPSLGLVGRGLSGGFAPSPWHSEHRRAL